jgi:hypothetical protein
MLRKTTHLRALLLGDDIGVTKRDRTVGRVMRDRRNRTRDLAPDLDDSLLGQGDGLLDPIKNSANLGKVPFQPVDAAFDSVWHQLVSLGA